MSIFPTKILLATDGSEEAELALLTAVDLAIRTDSELHVVHVGGEHHPDLPTLLEPRLFEERLRELEQEAREVLEGQVKKVEEAGGTVAEAHLRMGGPPDQHIVELAEEIGAGLIAMGSRGLGGIRRALMGSVSDSVVSHAHCPVLVVRRVRQEQAAASIFPKKILLATDGSEEATLAARTAIDIANKTGSELHVVHVGFAPVPIDAEIAPVPTDSDQRDKLIEEARRFLEVQVEQIEAAGGTVAQAHLGLTGQPDAEIVELAEEIGAGLIAMGSRGLGGIRRALMGSVSDSVVRHAHCPVLIVRAEKGSRHYLEGPASAAGRSRREAAGEKRSF
jgi:nucleotide-binding universal stress UspA family protein